MASNINNNNIIDKFLIHLNSENAYVENDGYYTFNIDQIDADIQTSIYLNIKNITIPHSFYNIHRHNNTLYFVMENNYDNVQMITITKGNYNANTLRNYLNTAFLPYKITVEYNNIQNKYIFRNTENKNFIFLNSSTCFKILGFDNNNISLSSNYILTSVNCLDFTTIKNIVICSNYQSNNFITFQNEFNNSNMMLSVPVNIKNFGLMSYHFTDDNSLNTYRNYMNEIKIKVTDENGYNIDFNGVAWQILIEVILIDYVN